jgi:multidrug resistance efflux pump
VPGNVIKIFVDDNQRVKQSAQLLEIDHPPYQIADDQKRAALRAAELALDDIFPSRYEWSSKMPQKGHLSWAIRRDADLSAY